MPLLETNMASQDKLGDLNVTEDELQRLSKALKNEEFRKLFAEYAEEISDPENRKRYEEEIAMLEGEKGVDVQFVHPDPGYVLKTSVDGTDKAFVNVCKNEHIGKPSAEKQTGPDGKRGLAWKIPHSFAPVRDDVDKNGGKCKVFDFVVHPDTYRMGETNERFRGLLHDTLSDSIKHQFDMQVDRKNLKLLKMTFKGTPSATVIRRKKEGAEPVTTRQDPDDILNKLPYPYGEIGAGDKTKAKPNGTEKPNKPTAKTEPATDFTTPKYTVKHRSELEMKDFCSTPGVKPSNTRPKELVVDVELPLLKSAAPVSLDIFEKRLVLQCTERAKYKLDISLPYAVDENEGSAKFDKAKHKLVITLPVIQLPSLKPAGLNGSEHANNHGTDEEDRNGLVDKPLIEVLGSQDSAEDTTTASEDEVIGLEQCAPGADVPCSMPEFSYNQTDETLTILMQVNRAAPRSVTKTYYPDNDRVVRLRAVSMGMGGFPIHYQLCLGLQGEMSVDLHSCHQDISPENVVFVLAKSDHCLGIWDCILVGPDPEHLQEKLLLTERTIIQQLDALDQQHSNMPVNKATNLSLEVTEMNSDKLTVEIKDGGGSSRRKKRLSESADDIEVVHDKQTPKLHGILKQRSRTLSESSNEEVFGKLVDRQNSSTSLTSSEGIITESDDSPDCPSNGRKKSVSFSEQVDSTTYKISNTVSSMHSTLKNKRRRIRKKEQKQDRQHQRRIRRSSGGSEPSSDEHTTLDNDSDADNVLVLAGAQSQPNLSPKPSDEMISKSPIIVEPGKEEPPVITEPGKEEPPVFTEPGKEEPSVITEPGKEETPVIKPGKEDPPVITEPGKEEPPVITEPGTEETPVIKPGKEEPPVITEPGKEEPPVIKPGKEDPPVITEPGKEEAPVITEPEKEEPQVIIEQGKGDLVAPCQETLQCCDAQACSNPDTMLSWKEGGHHSEHGTQCSVQLSNDIIYDLDTD